MTTTSYQSINIPKSLYNEVKRFITKYPTFGYTSIPEYLKNAIRTKLLTDLNYLKYTDDDDFFVPAFEALDNLSNSD